MFQKAQIGIIGGSGFYQFLEGEEVVVKTPYGLPSDKILLAKYNSKQIAFLPRHNKKHQLPPHQINYRANLYALKQLGCKQVLAPTAAGSLKPEIEPGHFVIVDQFINLTSNRKNTFFNGPKHCPPENNTFQKVAHISTVEPYCPFLRKRIIEACEDVGLAHHERGVVLVIEGPRFSTFAESNFYSQFADIINMTQYPEVALARELEMCYANISIVTDYDVGLKQRKDIEPVSAKQVAENFEQNKEKLKALILEIIKNLPENKNCSCQYALKDAFI